MWKVFVIALQFIHEKLQFGNLYYERKFSKRNFAPSKTPNQ